MDAQRVDVNIGQEQGFPELRYLKVLGDYSVTVTKGHPAADSLLNVHNKDTGVLLLEAMVQNAHDPSTSFFPAYCTLREVSVRYEEVAFFYESRATYHVDVFSRDNGEMVQLPNGHLGWASVNQTTPIVGEQIDRTKYPVKPRLDLLEQMFNELLAHYGFAARIDIRREFNPVARAFPSGITYEGFGAPKDTDYRMAMESLGLDCPHPPPLTSTLMDLWRELKNILGTKDSRAA